MKSRYSVFVIIVFLSFAWSREIYSGNDIDIERIQGVWFLTFGVDYWSWNVLWKCHIIAPFNVTDNRMNLGTYNFFKNKSKAPLSVIDEVKRDSQGQFWMKGPNEKIWENLDTKLFGNKRKPISNMEHPSQEEPWFFTSPHFYATDYFTFISTLMIMDDDRKLFQIYTRNPTINDGDISEFTTLAVEQGVDPTTLTTFGCGDLNPSEFMSA
uniref:uncharacterized protein LOC120343330 isoform X1 n=1 Tax=Styela clava TaxID=7725 RepID=UPI00193A567B|nr:uncharacterized protein LOC120343330 isoform X1 [Styela clava]